MDADREKARQAVIEAIEFSTAPDGSRLASVNSDVLAAFIDTFDFPEAYVVVDDDPLFQQLFAEMDAPDEEGEALLNELFNKRDEDGTSPK